MTIEICKNVSFYTKWDVFLLNHIPIWASDIICTGLRRVGDLSSFTPGAPQDWDELPGLNFSIRTVLGKHLVGFLVHSRFLVNGGSCCYCFLNETKLLRFLFSDCLKF